MQQAGRVLVVLLVRIGGVVVPLPCWLALGFELVFGFISLLLNSYPLQEARTTLAFNGQFLIRCLDFAYFYLLFWVVDDISLFLGAQTHHFGSDLFSVSIGQFIGMHLERLLIDALDVQLIQGLSHIHPFIPGFKYFLRLLLIYRIVSFLALHSSFFIFLFIFLGVR